MLAEIFRIRIKIVTQVLEKLLFLRWLLNLNAQINLSHVQSLAGSLKLA